MQEETYVFIFPFHYQCIFCGFMQADLEMLLNYGMIIAIKYILGVFILSCVNTLIPPLF